MNRFIEVFESSSDEDFNELLEVAVPRRRIIRERVEHFHKWDDCDFFARFHLPKEGMSFVLDAIESLLVFETESSQDAKEPSKHATAFRRASAALLKFLPPNSESNQPRRPSSSSCRSENLGKLLSTLYCKTLVLVGLVFPLAEVLVENGPDRDLSDVLQGYYLGYYIFLCTGSLLYLIWMYASMVKDRTVINIINSYRGDDKAYNTLRRRFRGPINRYGSFYLRLGAIAFGIGSMVYSGLEFGRGIERYAMDCGNITQVLSPAFRMMLTIAQMQFIFLNNQNMDLCNKPTLSRFGLMHLIATNLCEWLNVIIQESKHDIELIDENETAHKYGDEKTNATHECEGAPLMGSLIHDVSPFLFPCTIEYSLICAVIMLDMWMDVKTLSNTELLPNMVHVSNGLQSQPSHIFTVDCANAHKGLLCGLVTLVLTIICQILYFVYEGHNVEAAQFSINVCEMALYAVTFMAIIFATLKLRSASTSTSAVSYNMDSCLILLAQLGVSLHSVFRLIGLLLINQYDGGILIETGSLVQSISQTIFIVHGRSIIVNSLDSRPARQWITFLLPSNIALWTIDTLIRNRATSDPLLSRLFNPWAWTTVTRIAMPLAIFYRFHSTICLFEMWKNAYKRTHRSTTI